MPATDSAPLRLNSETQSMAVRRDKQGIMWLGFFAEMGDTEPVFMVALPRKRIAVALAELGEKLIKHFEVVEQPPEWVCITQPERRP